MPDLVMLAKKAVPPVALAVSTQAAGIWAVGTEPGSDSNTCMHIVKGSGRGRQQQGLGIGGEGEETRAEPRRRRTWLLCGQTVPAI
jgi:hypothetical protein